MTLRERIESYVESLGGEMDGFELTQDGLRAVLDAVLTETVIADTERDRLARIGELVEGLAADRNFQLTSHAGYHSVSIDWDGEYIAAGDGTTLLDALEALKERCG